MATTPPNDTNLLDKAIRQAVQKDTEYAFEEMKEKLVEDLDRKKDQIIGGVVLGVMKMVNYQTFGANLVITVRKIESNSN